MTPPTPPALRPLARAARLTELRLRTDEALRRLSVGLIPTVTSLGGWLTYVKLTHGARGQGYGLLLGATVLSGAATLGAVLWSYLRRYPEHAGAVRLDAAHGLHDRITSALSFAALPADQRTPLMEAAIEDAVSVAQSTSTRKAAPIHLPADLGVAALLGLLVAGLSTMQWSTRTVIQPHVATIDAVNLSPDDLDLYRDTLQELSQKDPSPETRAALEQFNQLIQDLAQKRLDRAEAFRRMEALEREMLRSQAADGKSLEDALKGMGDELKKNQHTKQLGESLAKKDLPKAQKDLKDLAQKLRDKKNKLSDADKKRLQEALAAAAKKHKESIQKLQERREQLRASLLQREQKQQQNQTEEEKRLLQRDKKELERLDRELEQKERAQRQLDRLDRELSQAAEDLMRDLGLTAEDLERGAEDINRMAQEEMTEKEKEELRQRLQELREILRQQGQGGEEMKKRMRKFAKKARGKGGQSSDDGDAQKGGKGKKDKKDKGQGDGEGDEEEDEEGEDGEGQGKGKKKGKQGQGDGDDGEEGEDGEGKGKGKKGKKGKGQQGDGDDGEGQGKGKGKGKGQGQGDGDGEWMIGPGGKRIQISQGSGQGQGDGQGQGQGSPGGQGSGQGGKQWGSGHDDAVAGKGTSGKFGTQDVQAAAADTGQGPNVSETIHGAAQGGFVGKKYKRVYTDYKTKAEEAMKNEEIPPGYRFYIQRYFQLIRPRD